MRRRERRREGETKIEAGTEKVEGRGRRRDWRGLAEAADGKGMGGARRVEAKEGGKGKEGVKSAREPSVLRGGFYCRFLLAE